MKEEEREEEAIKITKRGITERGRDKNKKKIAGGHDTRRLERREKIGREISRLEEKNKSEQGMNASTKMKKRRQRGRRRKKKR